ncbi:serine hydrolase domain-containing protein [Alkalihalobacterium bogoriense]|uniref:serine hydrolase domain-containing protein n=1 Tax=Alkalihalobacterium bogoriense TaxID=246272 RepID=UPI000479EA37|nr:serine hydrolase domain-containing protein [Alkalihalobacterium bogoriense]
MDKRKVEQLIREWNVPGVSIATINQNEVKQKHYGVLEADTSYDVGDTSMFHACSMSKLVTAILVMKLTEEGAFTLDENINNKLKSWKVKDSPLIEEQPVTLRLLLSHQGGIIDPDGSFSNGTIGESMRMQELLDGQTAFCSEKIEPNVQPGSEFHYSDAGYCIVQQVIEDVCDTSFEEVMRMKIFEPLNMDESTYRVSEHNKTAASGHNKNGVVTAKYTHYPFPAASGLWTTSRDLARVLVELFESLEGKGKLGLTKEAVEQLLTGQGGREWAGLGLFLERKNMKLQANSFGWGVGFQSMIRLYPKNATGIVIMTNIDLGVHQYEGLIGRVLECWE